jgi:hypothetical protein
MPYVHNEMVLVPHILLCSPHPPLPHYGGEDIEAAPLHPAPSPVK